MILLVWLVLVCFGLVCLVRWFWLSFVGLIYCCGSGLIWWVFVDNCIYVVCVFYVRNFGCA